MTKKLVPALLTFLLVASSLSFAQTLTNLAHPAPDGGIYAFQMTDGTVIVQGYNENDWWKLTPDINGSYLNGTWTQLASLPAGYVPYAMASAVLADGRLLIEGGEYNNGNFAFTSLGAIYDPDANTWTPMPPPTGWDFIGDSPASVMPNGKFLIGQKFTEAMAWLDPSTLTWAALGSSGKSDWFAEEGFTLMPDGTILTMDVLNNPNSERYITNQQMWVSDGSTIANLQGPPEVGCITYGNNQIYCPPGEIGPAILRPDGTVFATGAFHTGATAAHTSIYKPGLTSTDPGTWTPGPDFPNRDQAGDDFAVLLPSGHVLVEGDSGRLYEFDGTNLTQEMYSNGDGLMILPTGQVLIGGSAIYTPTGHSIQPWAPYMYSVPTTATRGQTYLIQGRQMNGMSQANNFGDEFETATNYPLVRIVNNATGHVFYAKTHGHSSMGVATGNAPIFTRMDIPAGMETGASKLYVVANGIPSTPYAITIN